MAHEPSLAECAKAMAATFALLGFEIELEDPATLFTPEVYAQLLSLLFSEKQDHIKRLVESGQSQGQKLQQLINLLSQEIPELEVDGINGQLIASGDLNQLAQFVSLLYQLAEYATQQNNNPDPLSDSKQFEQIINGSQKAKQKTKASKKKQTDRPKTKQAKQRSKSTRSRSQMARTWISRKEDPRAQIVERHQKRYQKYLKQYAKELRGIQQKARREESKDQMRYASVRRNRKALSQMLQAGRCKASLQLKARDEKDRFYKKMNTFLFKQEKLRQINIAKQVGSFKRWLVGEAERKLQNQENKQRVRMQLLREQLEKEKEEGLVQKRQLIESQRANRLRQSQRQGKVLAKLQNKFEREKTKIELLYGEDGLLQRQLLQLYKKL